MNSGKNLNEITFDQDPLKASKNNELAALIELKQILDKPGLTNSEKIKLYGNVKRARNIRNLKPGDHDALGFNLLHWATLCNQIEEVNELINKYEWSNGDPQKGADMDAPTSLPWNSIRNMTPLWIAAKHGYAEIVQLLLKNQAQPEIAPEEISSSCVGDDSWSRKSTPLIEAHNQKHKNVVRLLEQPALDAYIRSREEHSSEYKTTTSMFGLFKKQWGYSKVDKLNAAEALQRQLAAKDCTQEALKALKTSHPAVSTGDLGSIYKGMLKRS